MRSVATWRPVDAARDGCGSPCSAIGWWLPFDILAMPGKRTERHVGRLAGRMPRILLFCALGFLVFGVISVAVGVHADATNWWAAHPYLANLFASLTSALFGIPF